MGGSRVVAMGEGVMVEAAGAKRVDMARRTMLPRQITATFSSTINNNQTLAAETSTKNPRQTPPTTLTSSKNSSSTNNSNSNSNSNKITATSLS